MKQTAILFILFLCLTTIGSAQQEFASGKWEIGVHYSTWSIDLAANQFENRFTPQFDYYDPEKGNFDFKSNGNNYGIELRFFPKGRNGSFSIGFSYERNNFKAQITGKYSDYDDFGNRLDAEADGTIELFPHSFNLSFRWELFPRNPIHPYFGFGVGIGPLDGTLQLHTRQTVYYDGYTIKQEKGEIRTLKEALDELEEEGHEYPLSFFPILHVHFGIRAQLVRGLYLLGEVAVYDGFIFRGGLAVRI